jgi:hypothetical protein
MSSTRQKALAFRLRELSSTQGKATPTLGCSKVLPFYLITIEVVCIYQFVFLYFKLYLSLFT